MSKEQEREYLERNPLSSGDRPEPETIIDPTLAGTGAGAGQRRRFEEDQRRIRPQQEQWDVDRALTSSTRHLTQEEQRDIMKQANRSQMFNTQQRIERGEALNREKSPPRSGYQ